MANREELGVIRGARAGDPASQLALGKLYLFGGASLPRNLPTALHWLHRAALQQQVEAWMLIGTHIPFEHAQRLQEAWPWYQRAYAAGVDQAGRVLAQLASAELAIDKQPLPQQVPLLQQASLAKQDALPNQASLPSLTPLPQRTPLPQLTSLPQLTPWPKPPGETVPSTSDREALLLRGLQCAKMDRSGARLAGATTIVNFKRAIRWLTQAGEQGLADAWFALSRIYLKPEFSQRSVAEAQVYLERAAAMGHRAAQRECGMYAWRNRRNDVDSDVRAVYWLQQAASQQCTQAQALLARIAAPPRESDWMAAIAPAAIAALDERQPLLAARLRLADLFGLTRAEALLIDVRTADHGHCLVVDIRASYGRSKRRLIALRSARERQMLDQIACRFDAVEAGMEGNYRQRLYRLKTCVPAAAEDLLAA
jgi:TPR repeat protein